MNEDARKQQQREIQQLVIRMRKDGKSAAEIKAAKQRAQAKARPPKAKAATSSTNGKRGKKRSRNAPVKPIGSYPKTENQLAAEKREEAAKKHDLVIIPIFWKQKAQEKEQVLSAAKALKSKLAAAKLNVWIDERHKYTQVFMPHLFNNRVGYA